MTRWSTYRQPSDGRFVDKKDWGSREVPFSIFKIEESGPESRYGEQWLLHVHSDEGDKILSFTKGSGGRDEQIEAALEAFEAGEVEDGQIGPLILVQVRTKSGRPFWTIEDAEDNEGDTPFVGASNTGGFGSGAGDDDLPF